MKNNKSIFTLIILSTLSLLWASCVLDLEEDTPINNIAVSSADLSSSLIQSSSSSLIENSSSIESQACIEIYAPVCVEGKTFSNSCIAESAGYLDFTQGECEIKTCTKEYSPVCAKGKTFANACMAESAGFQNYIEGECGASICTMEYAPVCAGEKTFGNACGAEAAGFIDYVQGECQRICPEYEMFKPVCEEGSSVVITKDVDGCTSGFKCARKELGCDVIYNETDCLENSLCSWQPYVFEEKIHNVQSSSEPQKDMLLVLPMGTCKSKEIVVCTTVVVEEPKCLVGVAKPIYENGCLTKYECPSN